MIRFNKPMIGFCAYSGTGKTTLLANLIPLLKAEGLRLAVIKHAHHQFDIDKPGKDSQRYRDSGADQILIASRDRLAWIRETPEKREEPCLQEAVEAIDERYIDLLLVEGFKHEPYPKIELHRSSLGKPLIFPEDPNVIAFASDTPLLEPPRAIRQLDLNSPQAIRDFVIQEIVGQGGEVLPLDAHEQR